MSFLPDIKEGKLVIGIHKAPKKDKPFSLSKYLVRKNRAEKKAERKARKYKNRIPKKYNVYIKSPYWTIRKNKFYRHFGKKCAICDTTQHIDLHHMVYGNFGNEKDIHLVPLCRIHHDAFHAKIETKGNMLRETHEFIDEERQSLEWKSIHQNL